MTPMSTKGSLPDEAIDDARRSGAMIAGEVELPAPASQCPEPARV